jgi:hypothetical protein
MKIQIPLFDCFPPLFSATMTHGDIIIIIRVLLLG